MGDKLINPIVGSYMPIQGFPISKWDDHPPNLKSVHGKRPRCRLRDEIDSFEEKALADILSPWKFCWFCRFGRGGLHLTSLIWHCFRRFHQMFVAVLICFCNMFLLLFFLAFCKAKRVIVSWMADFSLSHSEDSQTWQVFPTTATTTATFHRVTLVWRDPLKLRSLKSSPVLLFICHPKSRLRQSKQTF